MKIRPTKRARSQAPGKIPGWIPLVLVALFFVLVWVGTRLAVRGYVVWAIDRQGANWDSDGVLIQNTRFSCVPCSIVMLLKDQGVDAGAGEVAWISGTDTKGTSPEGIKTVGNYYGFIVEAKKMGFAELMEKNLPAVVEFTWEGTLHAVFVRPDRKNQYLVVKNPSRGLTFVYENGARQYFGSDTWDVFLFRPE